MSLYYIRLLSIYYNICQVEKRPGLWKYSISKVLNIYSVHWEKMIICRSRCPWKTTVASDHRLLSMVKRNSLSNVCKGQIQTWKQVQNKKLIYSDLFTEGQTKAIPASTLGWWNTWSHNKIKSQQVLELDEYDIRWTTHDIINYYYLFSKS